MFYEIKAILDHYRPFYRANGDSTPPGCVNSFRHSTIKQAEMRGFILPVSGIRLRFLQGILDLFVRKTSST